MSRQPIAEYQVARGATPIELRYSTDEAKSADVGLAYMLLARVRVAEGDSAGGEELLQWVIGPLLCGLGPRSTPARARRDAFADSLAARAALPRT